MFCFRLNRMSVGWYLNYSPEPNLACDAGSNCHAARDVPAGEA